MDDVGLHLAQRASAASQRIGRALVAGMPKLLTALSIIGIAAMLWVGGHILLVGADELGWHAPYDLVHHLEEDVHHAVAASGPRSAGSSTPSPPAVVGLVVGAVAVAVMQVLPFGAEARPATTEATYGPSP